MNNHSRANYQIRRSRDALATLHSTPDAKHRIMRKKEHENSTIMRAYVGTICSDPIRCAAILPMNASFEIAQPTSRITHTSVSTRRDYPRTTQSN